MSRPGIAAEQSVEVVREFLHGAGLRRHAAGESPERGLRTAAGLRGRVDDERRCEQEPTDPCRGWRREIDGREDARPAGDVGRAEPPEERHDPVVAEVAEQIADESPCPEIGLVRSGGMPRIPEPADERPEGVLAREREPPRRLGPAGEGAARQVVERRGE
ncbi:MAG: hypothetical protein EBU70_13420, partial [Actinobacteria bacterium]|nr:hypothetical protein [Actinomycetota bacterium]